MTDELSNLQPRVDDYAPEDDYPPKGTPNTALIISITKDQYTVLAHTGRYFHGQINCAGLSGEEVGISNVPDEPGVWVLEDGAPWSSRDWETGIVDDYGIEGTFRKATPADFEKFGLECPMDFKTSGLLPTQTYADVSTAHITEADAKELQEAVSNASHSTLIVYELAENGWLVYAGPMSQFDENLSTEFRQLLGAVKDQGCTFLRLDRDGPVLDNLPKFDW